MSKEQDRVPMHYNPVTGYLISDSKTSRMASKWRENFASPWHFNPWDGFARDFADINSDPKGLLIDVRSFVPHNPMHRGGIAASPVQGLVGASKTVSTHTITAEGEAEGRRIANYASLKRVQQMAYDQAASGKGAERHARGQAFEDQRMQGISELLGSERGMAFQAVKKLTEGLDLPSKEAKIKELLGAMNYIAGIVIYLEKHDTNEVHVVK